MIGEKFREGKPVILDMTEMDDAGARRLVDFAAGLAFALRGSIDKVTTKVFMLLPPGHRRRRHVRLRTAADGFSGGSPPKHARPAYARLRRQRSSTPRTADRSLRASPVIMRGCDAGVGGRWWSPPIRLSGKSGDVNILWQVVYLLLWLFRLALLGRIVIEFVRVFARTWRPAGASGGRHGGAVRQHRPAGQAVPEDHSDHPARRGRVRPQHCGAADPGLDPVLIVERLALAQPSRIFAGRAATM